MRLTGPAGAVMCVLIWTVCFSPPVAAAQGKGAQPKEDAFFTGPAFTLQDILQRVGVIADKRLATAIDRRGVSFSPTPADYDKLKQAGASQEVLEAIRAKAPPPPPPPPPKPAPKPTPPPPAGVLTLTCAPADCEIVVNGKARGRTINGKLDLRDLPAGPATIDFQREGFEGQEVVATLHPGMPASESATLKPTPATQAQIGKALLDRMVQQFGGPEAFHAEAILIASGHASIWQSGGQRTDWQVNTKIKLPDNALVEINGAKERWWTSLSGADSRADGTRRMTGGPVALEMEKLVRMYRDYQPAALMARVARMKVIAPSAAPGPDGRWKLRATGADGSYQMTLEKDATLLSAVYESASGLGSGLEVLYSDYDTIQRAYYPKSMTIRFADQAQHGFELHFSSIKFGAMLTDKDFHR